MVAYEVLNGLPPYFGRDYDVHLVLNIFDGLRPNLKEVQAPQSLKNLIIRCWDAELSQRPTAEEIKSTFAD